MPQILEDQPNLGQQLAQSQRNFGKDLPEFFGQQILQSQQRQRQGEADRKISELIGHDISGVSPDIQKVLIQESLRQQGKETQKPGLEGASKALQTMKSLIPKKGIGWSSFNYGKDARFNRGKFEAMQAAIMPIFKGMFPRGMTEKEFKFVNDHYMPQINDTEAKIRGKIAGLEQLMMDQSGGAQGMDGMQDMSQEAQAPNRQKRPLDAFER